MPTSLSLNGPDFGPYSGLNISIGLPTALHVSTGQTSAHIPDPPRLRRQLNAGVSTGQTSAHIPDKPCCGIAKSGKVSTGQTSAHIPDGSSFRLHPRPVVSTGQTSAHIPDVHDQLQLHRQGLNGPDFGPYSGQDYRVSFGPSWSQRARLRPIFRTFAQLSGLHYSSVSTGQTSAHIPDRRCVDCDPSRSSQRARLRPIFRTKNWGQVNTRRAVSTGQTSAHIPDIWVLQH